MSWKVSRSTDPSGREKTWRTRNLTVLSGVSFLQDAASELLYPILPIFLTPSARQWRWSAWSRDSPKERRASRS